MSIRRLALAVLVLSLTGATSAHAGKALVSGPVIVDISESLVCVAVNVSGKVLTDISVQVFKGQTEAVESGTTCATEDPNGICGVGYTANSTAYRYCSITLKGSTKGLRARLCNEDTGECSDLR